MDRTCKNHPNRFCYICGHVVLPNRQAKITDFVKKPYQANFGVKLGDQDKSFTPHICCKICVEILRDWRNKKRKSMPFGVPMVWRVGKDHVTDCYFCMTNLKGINRKNKHHVQCPDVSSAIKPVCHHPDLPVPQPNVTMESSSDSESSDMTDTAERGAYKTEEDDQPVPLTQAKLNDLARDLNLSKESLQLLGSCLREKRLLAPGTTFYWYREREREFRYLFTFDKASSLVYCNNIAGLIEFLCLKYDAMEWGLFIDSSNRSIKTVLLNNGNEFSSIPVGHSVEMKESHKCMELLLSALNYKEYKWLICGDLKLIGIILGLQMVTQSIYAFCAYGIVVLMTSIMSDKSGHQDKD